MLHNEHRHRKTPRQALQAARSKPRDLRGRRNRDEVKHWRLVNPTTHAPAEPARSRRSIASGSGGTRNMRRSFHCGRDPDMHNAPLLCSWTEHPPLALLVDRDSGTRKMYADYLKFSACVIDEAEDGRGGARQGHRQAPERRRYRDPAARHQRLRVVRSPAPRSGDAFHSDRLRHRRWLRGRRQSREERRRRLRPCQTVPAGNTARRNLTAAGSVVQFAGARTGGAGQDARADCQVGSADTAVSRQLPARDVEPRAREARHDGTAEEPSRAHLPRVRPTAPVSAQSHRRRQLAAFRAVGLFRVSRRMRDVSVPATHPEIAESVVGAQPETCGSAVKRDW